MTVSVTYRNELTIRETLTTDVEGATAPTIIHSGFNNSFTLSGTTIPVASATVNRTLALTAGALTLDLTALVGTNGAAVTMNGLKLQCVKFQNPSTHALTVSSGASNGYTVNGGTWKLPIPAGGEVLLDLNNGSIAVDGTHKTIDIAGTGTDTINVQIVAG